VIEDRTVLRVGSVKPRSIDVRFVAATNRDLEAEIVKGAFRQDLYFRLNGISLVIPPLRERRDEIAGLARAFLATTWKKLEREDDPVPRLSPEALALLESYRWPGNIRELRNVIERAALLCSGDQITPESLPAERMRAPSITMPAAATGAPPKRVDTATSPNGTLPQNVKREVQVLEKQRILAALDECAGNQTHAARLLGISRATLVGRLDLYGIKRPRKPRA
jgi:two-component system, NtrC family, response regulator AtoC